MFKKTLVFCICLFLVLPTFAQILPSMPMGVQQKEILEKLQKENPKLAEFQERILDIQKEMQRILEDYQKGFLTKEKAKEKLRLLLREQIEITNNPDYMVEMYLFGILSRPAEQSQP